MGRVNGVLVAGWAKRGCAREAHGSVPSPACCRLLAAEPSANRQPDSLHQNISLAMLQACLAKQRKALSWESACSEWEGERKQNREISCRNVQRWLWADVSDTRCFICDRAEFRQDSTVEPWSSSPSAWCCRARGVQARLPAALCVSLRVASRRGRSGPLRGG